MEDKEKQILPDTIMGDMERYDESSSETVEAAVGAEPSVPRFYIHKTRPIVRDYGKIGRNEPCPCGSHKKYKNCCLASGKYETTHEN